VVADVLGRVIFNHPVKGTPEIISLSIVLICYLQTGYAIRSGGMLRVEALTSRLPDSVNRVLNVIAALLGVLFFSVIFYGSVDGALYAWTSNEYEGEGALRVPVWPAKFVIVMGSLLATINYLIILMQVIRGKLNSEELGVSH
jgi:TRAP-type C4-dicarboxylate transport system permease small subunit